MCVIGCKELCGISKILDKICSLKKLKVVIYIKLYEKLCDCVLIRYMKIKEDRKLNKWSFDSVCFNFVWSLFNWLVGIDCNVCLFNLNFY